MSKRLAALLEGSETHLLVLEHGERMDPSHGVTHRVQASSLSPTHPSWLRQ